MFLRYPVQTVVLATLSIGIVAYLVEVITTNVNPAYRQTEVGKALNENPVLRSVYDIAAIFYIADGMVIPFLQSEQYAVAVGLILLGGVMVVGWDMLLSYVAYSIRSATQSFKEKAEEMEEMQDGGV